MSRRNSFNLSLLALVALAPTSALAEPGDTIAVDDREYFEIAEIEQAGILHSAHFGEILRPTIDGEAVGCAGLPGLQWYETRRVYRPGNPDDPSDLGTMIEFCVEVTITCEGARWDREEKYVAESFCKE